MLGGLSGFPLSFGSSGKIAETYDAIKASMGPGFSTDPKSLTKIENLVYSTIIGATSQAIEALKNEIRLPSMSDTLIFDWCDRLGISYTPGSDRQELRNLCMLRLKNIIPTTDQLTIKNSIIDYDFQGIVEDVYFIDDVIVIDIEDTADKYLVVKDIGRLIKDIDNIVPAWSRVVWSVDYTFGFRCDQALLYYNNLEF